MAERITTRTNMDREAEVRLDGRKLADSIDAAARDLAENGPVTQAELAAMIADLETEWNGELNTSSTSHRSRSNHK